MTRQADLKRRIRARMERTGESYAAARTHVIAERRPDPGTLPASALHVTNGDSTVPELRATGLADAILPWRDALHEGPVPDTDPANLRRVRATFLSTPDPHVDEDDAAAEHADALQLLTVRDRTGVAAHLPEGYVRAHTTLAYAVTEYAAQGVTVDTGHHLVSPGADLRELYTSATRGRHTNTLYVVCRHDPDHHDPQRVDRPPLAVLADVLTRPVNGTRAAELERRAGAEDGRSLAWVGGQWDLLTAEYGRDRATDTLLALLGADVVQRVVDEPGYPRLMSAVRGMELAGHDPQRVPAPQRVPTSSAVAAPRSIWCSSRSRARKGPMRGSA